MSTKRLGMVLVVAGAVLIVASLGADALGIGNRPGFGWKQTAGTLAGMLVIALGVWLPRRGRK